MEFSIKIDYEKGIIRLEADGQLVQERNFTSREDAKKQGRDYAKLIVDMTRQVME